MSLHPIRVERGLEEKLRSGTPDLLSVSPLHNDHGNACRLIALYGGDLRYCHAFNKWLVWDGQRWAVDTTERARYLAKRTMLALLDQAMERRADDAVKFAKSSLDARRISTMLS